LRGSSRARASLRFNSFHWVDPELRFSKSAAVLRDGGALAVVGMRFLVHDDADPVWMQLQDDYESVAGLSEPRIHVDTVSDRSAEFEASGYFRNVRLRRYRWDITFDADAYISLLRTSSWHQTLDDDVRRRLFERIDHRIRSRPGQTIAPTMGVAERA
jgi:hypothetical protein